MSDIVLESESFEIVFVVPLEASRCSLHGPACQSVHRRSARNPEGNLSNFKVRLSNRIWANFAARRLVEVLNMFEPYSVFFSHLVRLQGLVA